MNLTSRGFVEFLQLIALHSHENLCNVCSLNLQAVDHIELHLMVICQVPPVQPQVLQIPDPVPQPASSQVTQAPQAIPHLAYHLCCYKDRM